MQTDKEIAERQRLLTRSLELARDNVRHLERELLMLNRPMHLDAKTIIAEMDGRDAARRKAVRDADVLSERAMRKLEAKYATGVLVSIDEWSKLETSFGNSLV